MHNASLRDDGHRPVPVRDPATPIKLALVLSAIAAVGLVAWNVFAALS